MNDINKQVRQVTDDNLLIKYKTARIKDDVIASKLGISVEEVNLRWNQLVEIANQSKANGHEDLCVQFNTLSLQYQLLGESLKIVGAALGDVLPMSEVSKLIVEGNKAQTLKNLSEQCIILRPFTPVNPVEALEAATQAIQQSN